MSPFGDDERRDRANLRRALVVAVVLAIFATSFFALKPAPVAPREIVRVAEPTELDPEREIPAKDEEVAAREPVVAPAPAVEPAKEPRAIVSGRVVDHESDEPIAHARIEWEPIASGLDRETLHFETAADGRFRFESPCDGSRVLTVDAEGHPPYVHLQLVAPPFDGRVLYVHLGDIRIQQGISPLIRVLTTEATPCAGAELFLFEGNQSRASQETLFLGRTDDRGEWRAATAIAVKSENTHVLAMTPEAFGWTPLSVFAPGPGGGTLEVRLRRSGEFAFHVQDDHGAPIPNVNVEFLAQGYPLGPIHRNTIAIGIAKAWHFGHRFLALTDDEGNATIANLPIGDDAVRWSAHLSLRGFESVDRKDVKPSDGEAVVVAMKPALLAHAVEGKVLDREGRPVPSAIVSYKDSRCRPDPVTGAYRFALPGEVAKDVGVMVKAVGFRARPGNLWDKTKDPVVLDFVLEPTGVVAGIVVDPEGLPIPGAAVSLTEAGARNSIQPLIHTDEVGTFQFDDVTGQLQSLQVSAPMGTNARYLRSSTQVNTGDRSVKIILERGPDPPRGSLRARVVDASTLLPVPVVAVNIVPEAGRDIRIQNGDIVRRPGEIRLRNVPDGRWRAWVLSSEGRVAALDFELREGDRDIEREITVGPLRSIRGQLRMRGEPFVCPPDRLPRVAALSGRDSWQAPSRDAWSTVRVVSHVQSTVASDGSFTLAGLIPGDYQVTLLGSEFEGVVEATLTTAEDVELVLDARKCSERAFLTLNNLDARFEAPLYVRIDREGVQPQEFEADPALGRTQTFPIASGASKLAVYPLEKARQWLPTPGTRPIKTADLDLAPGETITIALYPR